MDSLIKDHGTLAAIVATLGGAAGVWGAIRLGVWAVLRVKAARMLSDADAGNDAEAKVLGEVAEEIKGRK